MLVYRDPAQCLRCLRTVRLHVECSCCPVQDRMHGGNQVREHCSYKGSPLFASAGLHTSRQVLHFRITALRSSCSLCLVCRTVTCVSPFLNMLCLVRDSAGEADIAFLHVASRSLHAQLLRAASMPYTGLLTEPAWPVLQASAVACR